MHWTQSADQDMTVDHRGWPKGRRRTWTKATEARIKKLHERLVNDQQRFFTGPTAITDQWRMTYRHPPPPLRTVGRIMKALGLSEPRKKGKRQGASRYLCYPEYTIYEVLGGRVAEADFVGKKYITGRTAPIHFAGFSFKKEPKTRWYKRVEAETADCLIRACKEFFARYEKPDFLKVDNGAAMSGSGSGKRNISRTMAFLLKERIVPIFSVPRRPFSQASIEGNNSVFARFFWNRRHFESVEDIDRQLGWFNKASRDYYDYTSPQRTERRKEPFRPRVYFIRQVQEEVRGERTRGMIEILNERISLPKAYIQYFVLAEWNLQEEKLIVYFEKEQQSYAIKQVPFQVNARSKHLLHGCTGFM